MNFRKLFAGNIDENIAFMNVAEGFGYYFDHEISNARWKMYAAPGNVARNVKAVEEKLAALTEKLNKIQHEDQNQFEVASA